MQDLINELSKGWRAERSLSQMTLGKFISELEHFPKEKEIENICEAHSYRGYYSDLAFEKHEGLKTVGDLLNELKKDCLCETFEGYKGGSPFIWMNIHHYGLLSTVVVVLK